MSNEQNRSDLRIADAIVHSCWDNFLKTEPTYVLRDLIVIEIQKARDAEREACAKLAESYMRAVWEDATPAAAADLPNAIRNRS